MTTTTATARASTWGNLDVGECLKTIPGVGTSVTAQTVVTTVDCSTPHAGEVFLRTMVTDLTSGGDPDKANDARCESAFPDYTGKAVSGSGLTFSYAAVSPVSGLTMKYLTCLLHKSDDSPITGSMKAGS